MKCDLCDKEATIHYTQILNEQVSEAHMCEGCAKKKDSLGNNPKFAISDLLSSLTDLKETDSEAASEELKCSGCSIHFTQFKKFGRLGCAQCYDAFSGHLDKLLKRIHGSSQHLGKSPNKVEKEANMSEGVRKLRTSLETAIQDEKYEEAARIRDEIKKMEAEADETA